MTIAICVFAYMVLAAMITKVFVYFQSNDYMEGWEPIVGVFWPIMVPFWIGWYGVQWVLNNIKVERAKK